MLDSYRISSVSRVNGLIKLYPGLRPLADAMISKWSSTRQTAVGYAVDYLKDSTNKVKRAEFYRHIASTKLPSIQLVLRLRSHLFAKHTISAADAKEIISQVNNKNTQKVSQLDQVHQVDQAKVAQLGQVEVALVEQLLSDAATLTDIAKRAPHVPKEDWIDHGWIAVRMLDGGQRLVLIEIDALRDVQRPCTICEKKCSKRCGRCNAEFYCSSQCQKNDWQTKHQKLCNPKHKLAIEELRTILTLDFQPIVITAPPKQK